MSSYVIYDPEFNSPTFNPFAFVQGVPTKYSRAHFDLATKFKSRKAAEEFLTQIKQDGVKDQTIYLLADLRKNKFSPTSRAKATSFLVLNPNCPSHSPEVVIAFDDTMGFTSSNNTDKPKTFETFEQARNFIHGSLKRTGKHITGDKDEYIITSDEYFVTHNQLIVPQTKTTVAIYGLNNDGEMEFIRSEKNTITNYTRFAYEVVTIIIDDKLISGITSTKSIALFPKTVNINYRGSGNDYVPTVLRSLLLNSVFNEELLENLPAVYQQDLNNITDSITNVEILEQVVSVFKAAHIKSKNKTRLHIDREYGKNSFAVANKIVSVIDDALYIVSDDVLDVVGIVHRNL